MFRQGWNPAQVSRAMGVAYSAAWNWHKAWREEGSAGLAPKPRPQRRRRLTPGQLRRLQRVIVGGALRAGFPDDTWTCPRAQQWIRDKFGVEYHVDHLSKLLRALGLTPQLPRRQAQQRDEAAAQRFRKKVWPQLKKGRVQAV
jgi:transposase